MATRDAPARARDVRVDLGARSYSISIGSGLLARAGEIVAALRPGARLGIVTDETVDKAHGSTLRASLDAAGLAHATLAVAPGERSKDFRTLQGVIDFLLAEKLERGDLVIAFGGGVIGDLAGFAAAVTRRGMDVVQVPTSLLAQVDSAVGGKTGINTGHGKNLVGAFHQPTLVLADLDVLATLSDREFRAGYAEVAKYGLIDRPDFFEWLETNENAILAREPDVLAHAVAESCEAKAAVVAADEREAGQRALLNLGHTFGHALEAHCGYDANRLVHGEGVAIGTVLAHGFSAHLGSCDAALEERVASHLRRMGLPTAIRDVPGEPPTVDGLVAAMQQDKKVERGRLVLILSRGLGESFVARDVDESDLRLFLAERLEAA